jgi:tetratricopeptide (TPR) repeat protein
MSPNGMMQIWSGLLLRVENEAQLASVVGHEIGHYLQRHTLARLRDARTRSAVMTLMAPFGLIGMVGQLAMLGDSLAYGRDHEREADRIGVFLMQRAGYDPRHAAAIWRNLRAEVSAGPGGDPTQRSVLFATHPGMDEREATLNQLAAQREGTVGEAEHRAATDPWLVGMLDDELNRAQYDETIVLFERMSRLRPTHGVLRGYLGEARRLRGKDGDAGLAEADLQAALTLDRPPATVHRSLGLLARSQGRSLDADAAFEHYLKAAPQAPDAGLIRSYIQGSKTP